MRVKMLLSLGSLEFPDCPFHEGEEHEVSDSLGAKLVSKRLASEIVAIVPPQSQTKPQDEVEPPPVAAANTLAPKSKKGDMRHG